MWLYDFFFFGMQELLKIQSELLRYIDILVYGFMIVVDYDSSKKVES